MSRWTLSEIAWDQLEPAKIDPDMLAVIKTAALVEYNSHDYGHYLNTIFKEDQEFQSKVNVWVKEERQHGQALEKWAMLADPEFDFEKRFQTFTDMFSLKTGCEDSIRGSQNGELIARCIVETGTSSYYTALADACEEPVLKLICQKIAADEFCHFKLFYKYLQQRAAKED